MLLMPADFLLQCRLPYSLICFILKAVRVLCLFWPFWVWWDYSYAWILFLSYCSALKPCQTEDLYLSLTLGNFLHIKRKNATLYYIVSILELPLAICWTPGWSLSRVFFSWFLSIFLLYSLEYCFDFLNNICYWFLRFLAFFITRINSLTIYYIILFLSWIQCLLDSLWRHNQIFKLSSVSWSSSSGVSYIYFCPSFTYCSSSSYIVHSHSRIRDKANYSR